MNISYKWLKNFIDFPYSPRELAMHLTSIGLECDQVEEVESIKGGLKGIVIGKVLTCEDHPNSDHLHITTVDIGTDEPQTIVCGAPNVAAGQTVVVATIGTTLYDGDKEFQIKKSKIRGVESNGMICAEDEIGIGQSHDGIMVLSEEVAPGTPASKYFNVESDYVLEVELTPNRVDAASHYGVARDLKALITRNQYEGKDELFIPSVTLPSVDAFNVDTDKGDTNIRIEDPEGCPRYSGITIRGVTVDESPEWLRNFLTAIGQRPINNIVDITNFILHGIGQPLHCFDLAKVNGGTIVVKTCPSGTKFTTLDGIEHTLHEADLMICDEEKPLCIAGVFGGLDSGVTTDTKDVFIESAYFNPTRIRLTARRHGLSTDASFRYERGADPNITVYAAKLAALLIKELAGGEICGEIKDFYPSPVKDFDIDFSLNYCKRLIGKEIPEPLIISILKSLDINVEKDHSDKDLLHLKVPPYRVDVTRPCDVTEEILRIYGYNNVEFGGEMHITPSHREATDIDNELQQLVADRLSGNGFMEILNNSLSASLYYEGSEKFPIEECVEIMNPLSRELAVMRRSLLFGGLEVIAHNINRKAQNLRLYEFGNVYHKLPGKESSIEKPLNPFEEHMELALWLTGDYVLPSWNTQSRISSVFDLKGIVWNIFKLTGVALESLNCVQESDETMDAKLVVSTKSGKHIAEIGILSNSILKRFDISQPVAFAAIHWKNLFSIVADHKVFFKALPKSMPVRRDLALLIDKSVSFAAIKDIVMKSEKKICKNVELFDVYEGKNLPPDKKSYAIAITLQDDEKTLNDKQIDATMQKIIKALTQFGAELR